MHALFEHPVLGRGFRPFFLLGALYAVLIVPVWVLQMQGILFLGMPFDDPAVWHGHEMVYGFTMAIVAGFLLTAVANWTGGAPARQLHLAALCLLWLAGRVVMNMDIPYGIAAAVDLLFIPALAASLAVPLLHTRNTRNFVFLGLLAVLFACNAWLFAAQDKTALYVALLVIAAMISLIGGRIIPSFTVSALRRLGQEARITDQPHMDRLALASILLLGAAWMMVGYGHTIGAIPAAAAGIVHLWRFRVWHTGRILNDPLLLILHAGYLWLTASFFMLALAPFVPAVTSSLALHVLTAGSIGSMTIGMMVRVALGHTGRELKAGAGGALAFGLMQGAILARIVLPLIWADQYMRWLELSSGLWAAAFIVYLAVYTPVLWQRRPDGLPA